ncbi:MAG: HigA family addiction module antidote protein [Chlamydiae bacterium]|nr:HigA family addiction module antidote protein [Chlamydiota bacterium]
MAKKRKPTHPGEILEEDYITPLHLNLEKLAKRLSISRKTLHKIRTGQAGITVSIALSLAEAFDTTPQFWLNLQQKYDLWIKEQEHKHIRPIVKNGELLPRERGLLIAAPHRA